MTVYPLCVRIGRDPSFQEICALQDHWEAELLKCVPTMGDAPLVSSRCLSYFFCQFFFFYHLNDELSLLRDFWLITEVCVDLMDIQEVFRNKGNVCSRSEASG